MKNNIYSKEELRIAMQKRQDEKLNDLDINKYNISENQILFMKSMIHLFKKEIDYFLGDEK